MAQRVCSIQKHRTGRPRGVDGCFTQCPSASGQLEDRSSSGTCAPAFVRPTSFARRVGDHGDRPRSRMPPDRSHERGGSHPVPGPLQSIGPISDCRARSPRVRGTPLVRILGASSLARALGGLSDSLLVHAHGGLRKVAVGSECRTMVDGQQGTAPPHPFRVGRTRASARARDRGSHAADLGLDGGAPDATSVACSTFCRSRERRW